MALVIETNGLGDWLSDWLASRVASIGVAFGCLHETTLTDACSLVIGRQETALAGALLVEEGVGSLVFFLRVAGKASSLVFMDRLGVPC